MQRTGKGLKVHPMKLSLVNEEHRHKRKSKNPTHKGLGNNAMNEALN